MKQCNKCKQTLPFSSFGKNNSSKDGFAGRCKKCRAEDEKARRIKYPEKYKEVWERNRRKSGVKPFSPAKPRLVAFLPSLRRAYFLSGKKRCPSCGLLLLLGDFAEDKRTADKLYYKCKKCRRKGTIQWAKDNPEKRKAICKKNRENHPHYKRDRIMVDEKFRLDSLLRGRFKNWITRSGATKRNDMDTLVGFSRDGMIERLNSLGYIPGVHHVDHILPLALFDPKDKVHLLVSWNKFNLQPLTPEENLRKGDRLQKGWESTLAEICVDCGADYATFHKYLSR